MKKITLLKILFISLFMVNGLPGIDHKSLVQANPWIFKNPMPSARGFTGGAVVDEKIYVIGGFPSHYEVTAVNEMYDPAADMWTEMDSMPEARCAHATCAYNGKIYVFGGVSPNGYSDAKNNVYEYDPLTDAWTQKADMPYENAFCGIAVFNDTIYLIGGTTNIFAPPISTVMAYEPVTETWTQKADMNNARAFLTACVLDGKIYAFGGGDENIVSYAYKYVEVYDPVTNTWTMKNDMTMTRLGLNSFSLNGKIYVVGGVTDGLVVVNKNELYEPANDSWITKSPLKEIRHTYFLGMAGNKAYAIGGSYPDPFNPSEPIILASVEEYDPAADTVIITSVESNIDMNIRPFELCQNYPNPFLTSTSILYKLDLNASVKLSVYDLLGHEIQVLVNEKQSPGEYTVTFNAEKLVRGIYYYKMEAKSKTGYNYIGIKKLVLSK